MSGGLVLSLFSGLGALDEGFREAGYCVVSAGDVAWSSLYDVRRFRGISGRFDGVIGGPPCQSHSSLANLVRAKGLEPSFPDMTPEYVRVVEETRPVWFLHENVPQAPEPKPEGYDVRSFLLDLSTLDSGDGWGHEQMRRRRFTFGVREGACPELRSFLSFAENLLPKRSTAVAGNDGHGDMLGDQNYRRFRQQAVSGRHESNGMGGDPSTTPGNHAGAPPRRSIDEMLALQGLPTETDDGRSGVQRYALFRHSPLTVQGARKLIGNAVPLPMSRALARAVREAVG